MIFEEDEIDPIQLACSNVEKTKERILAMIDGLIRVNEHHKLIKTFGFDYWRGRLDALGWLRGIVEDEFRKSLELIK